MANDMSATVSEGPGVSERGDDDADGDAGQKRPRLPPARGVIVAGAVRHTSPRLSPPAAARRERFADRSRFSRIRACRHTHCTTAVRKLRDIRDRAEQTETFGKWLARLRDERAVAIITARINRLAFGHAGNVRSMGGSIREPCVRIGPGYRVFTINSAGRPTIQPISPIASASWPAPAGCPGWPGKPTCSAPQAIPPCAPCWPCWTPSGCASPRSRPVRRDSRIARLGFLPTKEHDPPQDHA